MLFLIGGYAGAGKTELSKMLSGLTRWPFLDKDTISRPFVEEISKVLTGNPDDRESDKYKSIIRPIEYQCLMHVAFENLNLSGNAIATAPFATEFCDQSFMSDCHRASASYGSGLTAVWVTCGTDLAKERIVRRNASRDRWKIENWPEYRSNLRVDPPPFATKIVDNSEDTLQSLLEIARGLKNDVFRV